MASGRRRAPRASGGTGREPQPGSARACGRELEAIARRIVACERCPRLRAHCQAVAEVKVRRFREEPYWGRPVPGSGDPLARLLVVGLAPAAHGANRTGRLFTGDDSAAWLFRALYGAGLANQPSSVSRDDGLRLDGVWISSAARCAPPENRPRPEEILACRPHLVDEMRALPHATTVLSLGKIAHDAVLAARLDSGRPVPRPRPPFAHGAEARCADGTVLLCSYHPSRQNTQTGRLTRAMLDAVAARAAELARASALALPGPTPSA